MVIRRRYAEPSDVYVDLYSKDPKKRKRALREIRRRIKEGQRRGIFE